MFSQTWRQHWGLSEDPFACEDADKDLILASVDPAAVHSGFDRIFGNPRSPAPGIVFGEKGSGKSGLRLMTKRWLERHNQQHPEAKTFVIEYVDFDSAIEGVQRSLAVTGTDGESAQRVLDRWELSDHLDAILSVGVTRLADELLTSEATPELSAKQRIEALVLAALYHDSPRRGITETLRGLRRKLHARNLRTGWLRTLRLIGSIAAVAVALVPHLWEEAPGRDDLWYVAGAIVLLLVWGATALGWFALNGRATRAASSVRVHHRHDRWVSGRWRR